MRYTANLDILRSIAVGVVLLSHLLGTLHKFDMFNDPITLNLLFEVGHAGVIVFFVHTSLVLMYSLERMHQGLERVTLRFYVRRFFRIYPLAIFVIILAVVLKIPSSTFMEPDKITRAVIVSNLFLVQNLVVKRMVQAPLWSLPYEVQMYLVLPLLFWIATRKNAPAYLSSLIAFFWILGAALALTTGHLNMAAYVPCFLSGVLCYSLRKRILARIPALFWPPFVLLLILFYCLANQHQEASYWSGWILSLILGLSINSFRDSQSRSINLFCKRTALYSYGIYLLNVPVLYLLFGVFHVHNLILAVLLFLGLTFLASMLTFHWIESPFIELGRRLSSPAPPGTKPELSSVAAAP